MNDIDKTRFIELGFAEDAEMIADATMTEPESADGALCVLGEAIYFVTNGAPPKKKYSSSADRIKKIRTGGVIKKRLGFDDNGTRYVFVVS